MRLENLALRWFAETHYASTTEHTYMETVRQLARRFPIDSARVTPDHLIDFLTLDADGSATKRSANTLHRQRTILRCFFRWAHRRGHIRTDPASDLDALSLGRGRRRAGQWLTRSQAVRLLASIDTSEVQGERDRVLILTALLTGLRRAELASLRWRDVDQTHARIAVMGKGSKPATVGLPDEALRAVGEWHQRSRREGGATVRPSSPVFPSGRLIGGGFCERWYRMDWHRPLSYAGVHQIVARRAVAAGLDSVGTHDLRRTFAGWLDEDGIDLGRIQAALRHSSPSVTVACYLDPSPRRAIEAVRDLRVGL
jgi:integrase/recombinase XerC